VQQTKTCPSKFFGLYAAIEWGLKSIEFFSPHSFGGTANNGSSASFFCVMSEHKNFEVHIPENNDEYVILCITNKNGDNCILMKSSECSGKLLSMQDMVPLIKRKFRIEIT